VEEGKAKGKDTFSIPTSEFARVKTQKGQEYLLTQLFYSVVDFQVSEGAPIFQSGSV
jgi:hypothetical protein